MAQGFRSGRLQRLRRLLDRLAALRRRRLDQDAREPAAAPFGTGHPDNPLTENLQARHRFGAALNTLLQGASEEALQTLVDLTRWRPGLAPAGAIGPYLDALQIAATHLPANLTIRVGLAEALSAHGRVDEARALAISAIRDSRPHGDALCRASRDEDPANDPEFAQYSFHPIDLGSFFKEGDHKTAVIIARETLMAHWPVMEGKSVLDIGSFTGWFSFEAERRGARSVTANDYYCWMVDFPLVWSWIAEEQRAGRAADPYTAPFPINDQARLPGRRMFDLTRAVLKSDVAPVFGPMETADLQQHDIVLLLGVIYHTEDPMGMLRRAFELTGELLIIETLSFEQTANLDAPVWRFYGEGVRGDVTTVWAPSSIGLRDALLKVGFSRVELLYGWDGSGYRSDWSTFEARLWVHAYR